MSELQELVDSLAGRIGRGVVIEDQRFRLVAFSSEMQDTDDARLQSILRRRTPQELVDLMLQRGVQLVLEPLRIAAAPELGMRARVCVPIRFDGFLLGYMWLIEGKSKLSDDDLEACARAGGDAAPVMYRERVLIDQTRERERHCVADLLDAGSATRGAVARAALEDGLLLASNAYGVIVVEAAGVLDHRAQERAVAVIAALERVRRGALPPHGGVVASIGACGVLIAALPGACEGKTELSRIAQRILADLRAPAGQSADWRLGLGPPVHDLAAIVDSYHAALDAIRIGDVIPELGEISAWEELGAWRLLSRIPRDDGVRSAIHPALGRLASLRDGDVLLHTLEAYLDSGGNAHATADRLCVHRTSMYARLRRIETVAGVDLTRGEDRLALHMSLRLQRLIDREHYNCRMADLTGSTTDARTPRAQDLGSRRQSTLRKGGSAMSEGVVG